MRLNAPPKKIAALCGLLLTTTLPAYSNQTMVEAEKAVTDFPVGYTPSASNKQMIEHVNKPGVVMQFETIAPEQGEYQVSLRYSNGIHGPSLEGGVKTISLFINDEKVEQLKLAPTRDWNRWVLFSTTVQLEKGTNSIAFKQEEDDTGWINADLAIVSAGAPEFKTPVLLVEKNHWINFGWPEDHPKPLSFMGGAFHARRPKLEKMDDLSWEFTKSPWHPKADQLTGFLVKVGDGDYVYPDEFAKDRRSAIKWSLANGYLPSPVSEWTTDGIDVRIQHVGARILDNSMNAVYSQVTLSNSGAKSRKVSLAVEGEAVAERCLPLGEAQPTVVSDEHHTYDIELAPGASQTFDFVSPANGAANKADILKVGGFDDIFKAEQTRIDARLALYTHPVSLPDERLIELWKATQPYMWNATVRTPDDLEQRGSGGNPAGFYQYDRTFDHDVPNMAIQYILEGNLEYARPILKGATFEDLVSGELKRGYLDSIPKYLVAMAQYLQVTGDTAFFDETFRAKIKQGGRNIHEMRKDQLTEEAKKAGHYGLLGKSNTLDNKSSYLVVDNFAALHGLVAYEYLCREFGDEEEAEWARKEMKDLNECLNNALDLTMKENGTDWYSAIFSFSEDKRMVEHPGNYFGTTMMMSTFPWGATLKGMDLGGTWKEYFDRTIDNYEDVVLNHFKLPEGSWGAWWGSNYGSTYNAGMGLQLLVSEERRTTPIKNLEWLLEVQTAPYQWGENFHPAYAPGDWNKPATGYETWGLGYSRQTLLQTSVSLHVDGTTIIGRGIPNRWLIEGKPIAWKNVRLNGGKMMDFSLTRSGDTLVYERSGDVPVGPVILNLPILVKNVAKAQADGKVIKTIDAVAGTITLPPATKQAVVKLKKGSGHGND